MKAERYIKLENTKRGRVERVDLEEIYRREYEEHGKELIINCPKVKVKIGDEIKEMHDITQVFDDFEEGKVLGRRWLFEK